MTNNALNPDAEAREVEEYQIELLEERLKIDRHRRKVGEVVIRKEIEIKTVEIPVRLEKLIIEQVGTETQRLAEVDLSRETITGDDLFKTTPTTAATTVEGTFSSLEQAIEILAIIARQPPHGCQSVQVKLLLEDGKFQESYQIMFQKYAQ
uniref:DUF2382 domain-containing protein n=2 Tax=Gloeothece TaxID=28070 RepID=E0U918_GLOV7|nr:Domain of unknown function DUF2382-like protein [Gloeothece verrucosa PCC 7822]